MQSPFLTLCLPREYKNPCWIASSFTALRVTSPAGQTGLLQLTVLVISFQGQAKAPLVSRDLRNILDILMTASYTKELSALVKPREKWNRVN